jgi:acetyl-CoA C-acetyltransferase
MTDAARIPVIVGVGQINDRAEALDSFELMRAALEAADEDAGGGWLKQVEALSGVDQLSFPHLTQLPERLADAFDAAPRILFKTKYPSGESPVLLLNEAAERIRRGEIEIAAVVGGEALRTAAKRAKSADANAVREAAAKTAKPLRAMYGLVAPTDVYPLYENASRAAWGQTLAEAQRESAEIWARFSEVAAANEHAWLRNAVTPDEIMTPSSQNRPIAFPYTKLMVANASVNQGAGFIVASLTKARAMGVPDEQLAYVGYGAAAREPSDVLARERYARSIALETALAKTLAFNQIETSALDCVELYSCFPCIPKLARRAIGWPLEKPMSAAGGLTFAGGPVGNYMSHAIAAMTARLRRGVRAGLLFGNGGFANTNHCIVLTRDAPRGQPRPFDVQDDADAQRAPGPRLIEVYEGAATVETYTIFYDREGAPKFGVVVARTPEHARFLARVEGRHHETIARLTSGADEPVGAAGKAKQCPDGLNHWEFT